MGAGRSYGGELARFLQDDTSVWHGLGTFGRLSGQAVSSAPPSARASAAAASRVLVIDNDPSVRSLLCDLLDDEGYRVGGAADGRSGLELARREQPDTIVLDLALPEVSGIDVLHALKADAATRDIAVLVVSAYTQALSPADAASIDGVLEKPFDLDDLLGQVRQASATA
jgi:CheY-like chemotaxis protein